MPDGSECAGSEEHVWTVRAVRLDHADAMAERLVQLERNKVRLMALAFWHVLDTLDLIDEQREVATRAVDHGAEGGAGCCRVSVECRACALAADEQAPGATTEAERRDLAGVAMSRFKLPGRPVVRP